MPPDPRAHAGVGALSAGRRLVVEADGGSRGNPGPAAYGALVRDAATGEVLVEVAEHIGRATNNVAEYRGLIAGLRAARELDAAAQVEARLDSKLVVEQMSGRWKVKHPDMQPLAAEAARVLPGRVRFSWVPRERNREADRLANEALDDAAAGRAWTRRGTGGPATGGAAVAAPLAQEPPAGDPEVAPAGAPEAPNRLVGWEPDLGTPTTLVLVRHGETELTAGQRFSGSGGADPGLTERGRWQARRVAAELAGWQDQGRRVDALVTSPLARARETAAAVGDELGVEPRAVEGLREASFGRWDGLTYAQVRERDGELLTAWLASSAVAPPGGESYDAVARRAAVARDQLLARHPGRTVVVVAHGIVIKQLVRLVLGAPPASVFRMDHAPASITVTAHWSDGGAALRVLNDTGHLR